jgi:hypothetical protein
MVPIVAREVNADTVPEAMAKLNWIFCRDGDDFEKATDELISALDTDLKWVHEHTRLLTRAIEWNANGKNNSFILHGDDLRSAEQWLAQAGAEKERQPTHSTFHYRQPKSCRPAAAIYRRQSLAGRWWRSSASVAWKQRTKVAQEKIAQSAGDQRTSKHVDLGLALLRSELSVLADPLLSRALRTQPDATGPKEYLISLFRRHYWSRRRTIAS